jgi:flavodoxin
LTRKILILLISFSLLLSGCSEGTAEKQTAAATGSETSSTETAQSGESTLKESSSAFSVEKAGSDSLVVYFSLAGEQYGVGEISKGNTAIVADKIAEKTGADTFEIVPVNNYPADLQSLFDVAAKEQDENARPDYIGDVENWDQYKTVYIGYPLWYDDMPMIVYHFLEDHDFTEKTVYPFDTSGGQGLLGTVDTIRSICAGADVKDGLTVRGSVAQNNPAETEKAVDNWLKKNGILP